MGSRKANNGKSQSQNTAPTARNMIARGKRRTTWGASPLVTMK